LQLNDEQRAAHLAGDIQTILDVMADEYVQVRNGQVYRFTPQENVARFENYLTNMKILAWDDLVEPIIMIADDATLATMIVSKRLAMVPAVEVESAEPVEYICAWQATYRRTPDGWVMIADATTELPKEPVAYPGD